ncbi:MAG: amino acid racemase [Clostridia bacterium]|nr:amino acid racemase [Clostridia bacterium]
MLGILGGLGPMSTVYFYEMLTAHTEARCDQEHLNIVISSYAETPDRTDYILGRSEDDPRTAMIENARKLESFGATVIAIPCNTAHYFYSSISDAVSVPVLNIIEETVRIAAGVGIGKIGILATEGTVQSESYRRVSSGFGIECLAPDKAEQAMLTDIIYGDIKQGKRADMDKFYRVAGSLLDRGCEKLILGCTELSLIKRNEGLGYEYLDSLEALAYRTILACGKPPCGFPAYFGAR